MEYSSNNISKPMNNIFIVKVNILSAWADNALPSLAWLVVVDTSFVWTTRHMATQVVRVPGKAFSHQRAFQHAIYLHRLRVVNRRYLAYYF